MKGIMLKDLYTYRNYAKTLAIALLVYTVAGGFLDTTSILSTFIVIMASTYATGLFSYDENAKFDRFACTLPVSRRRIVVGRYLLNFLLLLGLTLFCFAYNNLLDYFIRGSIDLVLTGVNACTALFLGLFMISILYPISYKFGSEKARVLTTVVFLAVFAIIMLVVFLVPELGTKLDNLPLPGILIGIVAGILALYAGSCLLSANIYAKKEF